jgi:predicted RNA-binding protein YlxR (DUF448 family)
MRRAPHIPQRTCVACRQTRPKAELLRIVRTPAGAIVVDPSGKAAGRGAYVCHNERCPREAVQRKKLSRALGAPVGGDMVDAIRSLLGGTGVS